MQDNLNRRTFLGHTASAGAAVSLAGAGVAQAASTPDTIVVGVMGMSRGRTLAERFSRLPGVQVKYVCDVDSKRAASGVAAVQRIAKQPPKAISDFRRILDDRQVDALVCAAPNHWHAPATILACSAGKHVYVEKPCSHNPREGELMVAAARKFKRAVQMGTQRRSGPGTIAAIQALHAGVIGRAYLSRSWYANARGPIGTGKAAPVPSTLDYDLWQGPAPRQAYLDNRVPYNWHWVWHWGNGELGNNGVHTLDLCRWGLGVDYPIRVTSSGGRYRFDDDQETPDTHVVSFDFDDRKTITWNGLSCNRHRSSFVTFYGEDGTLDLEQDGSYTVYDARDKQVKRVPASSRGDVEHITNFLAAIRNETPLKLNSEILKGHKSTLLCHLGNIAHRTGNTLNCDPSNGRIRDDDVAMKLWAREYEPGWEPKV